MRSLIRYLLRNYAFVLFILLEIAALALVFNNNNYHKAKYLNSSNRITGNVYNTFNSVINYFELAKVNKKLSEENAYLKGLIEADPHFTTSPDTIIPHVSPTDSAFRYTSARVINNSVNRPFNYVTLNKGRKDGIKPDQGIISSEGVVGVVINVSESYSLGLSVLNRRWSISAKLRKNGYFGSLIWTGNNYRKASLMEIPYHVDVAIGDTVVTSGYSSVFPEGVLIGTVSEFDQAEGENYYNIKVELSTDYKSLSYVEVIENLKAEEIKQLEEVTREDALSD